MAVRNIIILVAVTIIILLLIDKCSGGNVLRCNSGRDTILHKIDTVVKESKDSIVYVPVPYRIDSIVYVKGKPYPVHDTLEIFEPVPTDTAAILARYNQKVYYSDTHRLSRGWVAIQDTVWRNRISGRKVVAAGTDTTIREILVVSQPVGNLLYLGFSASSGPSDLFHGVGADLSFKAKNDKIYGLGVRWEGGSRFFGEAQFKFPIKLK